MTEYKGWDDYVNRKRTNEQLKQIKEEWKDAVNDYFGITIPTAAYMKQIEFQISKLRNDIHTIHTRINQITDCGHGKLKQMITPLHQGNVIGRIEALEQWRERILRLEEWKQDICNWGDQKVIDKKVWDQIKYFTSKIDHYSWPKVDSFGDLRACVYKLKQYIKEVDTEFCPND